MTWFVCAVSLNQESIHTREPGPSILADTNCSKTGLGKGAGHRNTRLERATSKQEIYCRSFWGEGRGSRGVVGFAGSGCGGRQRTTPTTFTLPTPGMTCSPQGM